MLPPHRLAAGNRSAARALRRSLATAAPPTFHPTRLPPYQSLCANLDTVRKVTDNAPLSLAEKILFSHLRNPEEVLAGKRGVDLRGKEYLPLRVDRLAMQGERAKMDSIYSAQVLTSPLSRRRRIGANGSPPVYDLRTATNGRTRFGPL